MTVMLNGKEVQIPDHIGSVQDLLTYYELHNRIVVVEVNAEIVLKEHYTSLGLSQGDRIEMIHFVGGG
ncbi:sulfur carrier protein ThiS [Peribacillus kribbensis]|uniref:sulfur carrier protein ThiS n=1 Tax=Peribacillus kribbensis TaxID=356658 RepID=UPI0004213429|nr:sulfur carrier protein ThiS [Peribacillus kribbensis]